MTQRIVIVTGAASGIGHATAAAFAALGDTVYGLDLGDTVADGVIHRQCDVSSKEAVDAVIGAIGTEHGRIDVLANVAGIVQFGRFDTISEAQFDRTHAVDIKGPFLTMQAALPWLRTAASGPVGAPGNIVNVSSVAGNAPQPYSAAYSAAKGGLTMLGRALAVELAPENIRVNTVCPGSVDTPLVTAVAASYPTDLDPRASERLFGLLPGGAIHPSEIATAIVYLASADARMITGAVFAIDGGMS